MLNSTQTPDIRVQIAETEGLGIGTNTTTKAELLSRAKEAVQAGDQSLHDAAEKLAIAQELHDASQAEMARAIGKSEAWVSRLLQWHLSGYRDESPFGPKTKAGRLAHAKDRVASGASKLRKSRMVAEPDQAEDSAESRKAEYAGQEAIARIITSDAPLAELMAAVDRWLPEMNWNDQGTAFLYFKSKMTVPDVAPNTARPT